jgi:hypothetical protein
VQAETQHDLGEKPAAHAKGTRRQPLLGEAQRKIEPDGAAIVRTHVQVQLAQASCCGEGNGHRAHAASDPLAPMPGANREPKLRPVAQARLGRPHDGQDCDEPAAHHALEHEATVVAAETAQKRHLRR